MDISGKTAIVTGAASGIGLGIATALAEAGANVRDRSGIYLDALPLFTSGRARLIDNPRLIHQFASLERRTSRAGRDRVDHPVGGADDVANAAAGAMVRVGDRLRPVLWRAEDLPLEGAA